LNSPVAEQRQHALTVLIADDDPGFRRLVKRVLEEEKAEARVIAEAGDGEEAIRLARALRPDVVLMDIAMPRLGGLEAVRRTKADLPETKIIVVTIHGEEAYRKAAEDSGADAFVLKKTLSTELVPAIRRVVA
jgi:DNA-binding NarL/FixJ family response regulator